MPVNTFNKARILPLDDPRWASAAGRAVDLTIFEAETTASSYPNWSASWESREEGAEPTNPTEDYVWAKLSTFARRLARQIEELNALAPGAYAGADPRRLPAPTLKRDSKNRISAIASQFLRATVWLSFGKGGDKAAIIEVSGGAEGLARLKAIIESARANPLVGTITTEEVFGDETRELADREYVAWFGTSAYGMFHSWVETDDERGWGTGDLRLINRQVTVRRERDQWSNAVVQRWLRAGAPVEWLSNLPAA